MPVMKEVSESAKWLVDIVECISDNPQLIVSGFLRSGITGAFDGNLDDIQEEESDSGNESSQEDLSSDEPRSNTCTIVLQYTSLTVSLIHS